MVHENITRLSLLSERNQRGMSTHTRRGEAPEFGFDVDPEAQARAIREAKRGVAKKQEEAAREVVEILFDDEEQLDQAVGALQPLRGAADDALDVGVDIDELSEEVSETIESFVSAVQDGDAPEALAEIEESATNISLDALVANQERPQSADHEAEYLSQIDALSGEEETSESEEEELALSEAEESTDEEFVVGVALGDLSTVRAAESSDSDDEWSTATSPTPVPERHAALAARLVEQVGNPQERGVRSEEAEAADVGEMKARKQQEAAAASRARREDPQEQERKRAARKRREAAKVEEAANAARLALMRKRFADTRAEISLESRQVSAPGASTVAAHTQGIRPYALCVLWAATLWSG